VSSFFLIVANHWSDAEERNSQQKECEEEENVEAENRKVRSGRQNQRKRNVLVSLVSDPKVAVSETNEVLIQRNTRPYEFDEGNENSETICDDDRRNLQRHTAVRERLRRINRCTTPDNKNYDAKQHGLLKIFFENDSIFFLYNLKWSFMFFF